MYKIYEIRCNETDEVYIGKTTGTLEHRLCQHKYLDCSSKQIILRGDYIMSEIDSCDTEEESIELEAHYIRNTDKCVNIVIPGRTKQEYYEENKDVILEKLKEYYEENKDVILEKRKEYYEEKKNEIRNKQKEYYEENKDEILERLKKTGKEYRKIHKDEIENKRKEKYTCECGSIIRKDSKSKHEKALLHINFINSK
jgi:hypothetical protein